MDQARCLHGLCLLHKRFHHSPPVLAFLDMKSAYDIVDRSVIWNALEPHLSPPLLSLLKCLFDDVSVEVLLSNVVSRRLFPVTGVLQGSILSTFLYSF